MVNINNMMKQAQQLQKKMAEAQAALHQREFSVKPEKRDGGIRQETPSLLPQPSLQDKRPCEPATQTPQQSLQEGNTQSPRQAGGS